MRLLLEVMFYTGEYTSLHVYWNGCSLLVNVFLYVVDVVRIVCTDVSLQ